mgnify:CR=1 FL=1
MLSRLSSDQSPADKALAIELPRKIFSEMGAKTTFHSYNYPRLMRNLDRGIVDAGAVFRFNGKFLIPENAQFSCADNPHLGLPLIVSKLAHNHSIPDRLSLADLEYYSIGYFRSLGKDIDPFISKPNFKPANDVSTLFKMLKSRRIDLVLADYAITEGLSRRLNVQTQEVFKAGFLEVFMCVSHRERGKPAAKQLANNYRKGLQVLWDNGYFLQFLERWGLEYHAALYLPQSLKNAATH